MLIELVKVLSLRYIREAKNCVVFGCFKMEELPSYVNDVASRRSKADLLWSPSLKNLEGIEISFSNF